MDRATITTNTNNKTAAMKAELTMHNTSSDPKVLLRLVGMPQPNVIDATHSMAPGFATSEESATLNALAFPTLEEGEESDRKLVDTVDATNEDPFTLESFEDLIRAHADKGKDFLLARVVTMEERTDGSDEPGRLYYSYYSAHHINKVLFRTQPEEGLLHRMKSKNPLNNMLVVGDVHYYVVRTSDPNCNPLKKPVIPLIGALSAMLKEAKTEGDATSGATLAINKSTSVATPVSVLKRLNVVSQSSVVSLSAPSSANSNGERFFAGKSASQDDMALDALVCHHSLHQHHHRRASLVADDLYTRSLSSSTIPSLAKSDSQGLSEACLLCSLAQQENGSKSASMATLQDWQEMKKAMEAAKEPLTFTAHYYATDDDYLMRRFVREYFKMNALNAEEIFMFTLYGSSQQNGDSSFSTPLVSDPTNPNARAVPLEQAVARYQESRLTSDGSLPTTSDGSIAVATVSGRSMRAGSSISMAFQRIRNLFDRPPTPAYESSSSAEESSSDSPLLIPHQPLSRMMRMAANDLVASEPRLEGGVTVEEEPMAVSHHETMPLNLLRENVRETRIDMSTPMSLDAAETLESPVEGVVESGRVTRIFGFAVRNPDGLSRTQLMCRQLLGIAYPVAGLAMVSLYGFDRLAVTVWSLIAFVLYGVMRID